MPTKINLQLGLNFIFKFGTIIFSILLMPLMIKYTNKIDYGLWLTISSFISWFTFFDLGFSMGLRNKFAESVANNDRVSLEKYISTAYFTVTIIAVILFVTFYFVTNALNWSGILGASEAYIFTLQSLIPILFAFFCIQLILRLVTSLYLGDNVAFIPNLLSFTTQMFSVIIIYFLGKYSMTSLFIFSITLSALPLFFLLLLNFFAYRSKYREFKPSIKFVDLKSFWELFSLGGKFFILQLSVMILFTTDNFIISNICGPSAVIPYNISNRYFGVLSQFQLVFLAPFWSIFTDFYVKKENDKIRKKMSNLIGFSISLIMCLLVFYWLSPIIYKLWFNNEVVISRRLDFLMMVYFAIVIFYSPFNYFINGSGKITLHTIGFVISAIINIPLSYFFAKYLGWGAEGVILATIICVFPFVFIFPFQYKYLLTGKSHWLLNK